MGEVGQDIFSCAAYGEYESLESLVRDATARGGSDVINQKDTFGLTPLIEASKYGHIDAVGTCLRLGAKPDAVDSAGCSALHYACAQGSLKVSVLLLEHGSALDVRDKQGKTPLDWAEQHGHFQLVKTLEKLSIERAGAEPPPALRDDSMEWASAFRSAPGRSHIGVAASRMADGGAREEPATTKPSGFLPGFMVIDPKDIRSALRNPELRQYRTPDEGGPGTWSGRGGGGEERKGDAEPLGGSEEMSGVMATSSGPVHGEPSCVESKDSDPRITRDLPRSLDGECKEA